MMPGPDILYVITESLAHGKRWGVAIALGLVTGLIFHTTLVATGVGLFIQEGEWLYTAIKYAGAIYLLYLAYQAAQDQGSNQLIQTNTGEGSYNFWHLYRRGIMMNILNPKVTLFFLAFLPGFIDTNLANPYLQISYLGLIFMIQALLIFVVVSYLADKLSRLLKLQRSKSVIYWLRIIVLIGIALLLLI